MSSTSIPMASKKRPSPADEDKPELVSCVC